MLLDQSIFLATGIRTQCIFFRFQTTTDPFLSDETNSELEKISDESDPKVNKTLDDFFDAEEAKALKPERAGTPGRPGSPFSLDSTSGVSGCSDETKEE